MSVGKLWVAMLLCNNITLEFQARHIVLFLLHTKIGRTVHHARLEISNITFKIENMAQTYFMYLKVEDFKRLDANGVHQYLLYQGIEKRIADKLDKQRISGKNLYGLEYKYFEL
eukprot:1392027-Amorphochlora_amoeboformis.AAC.1